MLGTYIKLKCSISLINFLFMSMLIGQGLIRNCLHLPISIAAWGERIFTSWLSGLLSVCLRFWMCSKCPIHWVVMQTVLTVLRNIKWGVCRVLGWAGWALRGGGMPNCIKLCMSLTIYASRYTWACHHHSCITHGICPWVTWSCLHYSVYHHHGACPLV